MDVTHDINIDHVFAPTLTLIRINRPQSALKELPKHSYLSNPLLKTSTKATHFETVNWLTLYSRTLYHEIKTSFQFLKPCISLC